MRFSNNSLVKSLIIVFLLSSQYMLAVQNNVLYNSFRTKKNKIKKSVKVNKVNKIRKFKGGDEEPWWKKILYLVYGFVMKTIGTGFFGLTDEIMKALTETLAEFLNLPNLDTNQLTAFFNERKAKFNNDESKAKVSSRIALCVIQAKVGYESAMEGALDESHKDNVETDAANMRKLDMLALFLDKKDGSAAFDEITRICSITDVDQAKQEFRGQKAATGINCADEKQLKVYVETFVNADRSKEQKVLDENNELDQTDIDAAMKVWDDKKKKALISRYVAELKEICTLMDAKSANWFTKAEDTKILKICKFHTLVKQLKDKIEAGTDASVGIWKKTYIMFRNFAGAFSCTFNIGPDIPDLQKKDWAKLGFSLALTGLSIAAMFTPFGWALTIVKLVYRGIDIISQAYNVYKSTGLPRWKNIGSLLGAISMFIKDIATLGTMKKIRIFRKLLRRKGKKL